MNRFLEGRTAVVTGGAAGIGHEICRHLVEAGAAVAVCDVAADAARETAAGLGDRARAYSVNVADFAAVQAVHATVEQDLGPVGILVNNAGITRDNLLLRMTEQEFDLVVAVNLKGAFNLTKACYRSMARQRWGRIVNIASVVGQMGNAGQANYASAKAGLIGLTKSTARELAGRGVTVNAVAPGFIETAMTGKLDQATREAYMKAIPLGRFGKADDVASACLFLVSDSAAYITGQVIRVDGGMLM